eukprot:CAMPEP_0176297372 /NCGR_PEP_ID=MMETSP0121_2-20121125/58687_1 /TAXON_ID=160619 /ORGANISM="Kryptoperidinium foliaceum, Strain CCMP 1326" /LENGTH=80 /DNA_ID=CAMNT_0017638557 /DNA_START=29 /DNA_END=268 /DNA_ORIENTATION=-
MAPKELTEEVPITEATAIFKTEAPFMRVLKDTQVLRMQKREYHELVKRALEDVVVSIEGFSVSKFLSVDGDMEFWKVNAS